MKFRSKTLASFLAVLMVLTAIPMSTRRAESSTAISQVAHNRLHTTVALYIGSHRAVANNKMTQIDPLSALTKPIIQNARTLVPVRFIAENFGAEVGWVDATLSVPITLGNTTVVLKIGSRTMWLNGKAVTLDVTPVIHNKRTFVPLRAITEAFGKHVFYDRELIVVSDQQVLDASGDKTIVDEIINWFKTGKMPAWQNPMLTMQQLAARDISTVAVVSYGADGEVISQGSGFSLGNGLFATAVHVLLGGEYFEIIDNDDNIHEIAGVVSFDLDWGLAVIRTHAVTNIPALPLGLLSTVKKGDPIVAIGSPLGMLNTVSTGIVSNIHVIDGQSLIQISAPLAPGSSGGVLLNMYGQAIGVTSLGIEGTDFNFVVPIDYLMPLHNPYKNMALGSVPLVTLPVIEEPQQPKEPPVYELAKGAELLVDVIPQKVVMHPTEPIMYISSYKTLSVINYQTLETAKLTFDLSPVGMTFANGELFVALLYPDYNNLSSPDGQMSEIVVIDPSTLAIKENIKLDFVAWDIVVDRDGYIYACEPTGDEVLLISVSRTTGERLSEVPIRWWAELHISPTRDEIYVHSFTTITVVPFSQGQLSAHTRFIDTQHWASKLAISPDGTQLYLSSGWVLNTDLVQVGTVYGNYKSIAFDPAYDEVYLLLNYMTLRVFSTDTFEHLYTLKVEAIGEHYYFHNDNILTLRNKNNKLYLTVYPLY